MTDTAQAHARLALEGMTCAACATRIEKKRVAALRLEQLSAVLDLLTKIRLVVDLFD